jgi:mRNA interferase MazF
VKRGEIWTASAGSGYAGKPHPVVLVQNDRVAATTSVTLCAFTTDPTDAPLLRLLIEPTPGNGLLAASRIMVDKVTTVSRDKVERRIGQLGEEDLVRLNRALLVFLGLAG